jgi:heme exporter protein A
MATTSQGQPAQPPAPGTEPGAGARPWPGEEAVFEAVELTCTRRDRVLFEGFSFRLEAGELLQIEGANGSGKTSLLRILCLFALADAGEVRWNGANVEADRADYLARLTYIGHTPGVKADLTAFENLEVASAMATEPAACHPDDALEAVGLAGFEDTYVRELSAGQTRRVALARLLLQPTRLWILDEPFTALDRAGKRLVEGLLEDHCAAGGMALITTHQPVDVGDAAKTRIHLGPEPAPVDEAG